MIHFGEGQPPLNAQARTNLHHSPHPPAQGPERIRPLIESGANHLPRITPKSHLANGKHIVAGDELISARWHQADITVQDTHGALPPTGSDTRGAGSAEGGRACCQHWLT